MNDKRAFPGGYNILLAEDDKINQVVVTGFIKKLNLGRVKIVENGKEAVKMFCSHRFDLILMDGEMPEMNGIDATLEIRAIEKDKNLLRTPIIALTAHATAQDRAVFLKSGMDEFLKKPLSPEALTKAVQRVIQGRRSDALSGGEVDAKDEIGRDLEDPLDLQELKRIMRGKKSLLKNCLQAFESTYLSLLSKMTTCIEKNDYDELKNSAHRLKGMLKYLAAHKAATLAGQLESMGVSGNIAANADITVQTLNDECHKIIECVRQVLAGDFS
ncbi:response regulator [Desulfobacter latus]|uniref:Response regulator n=1 Tax=Desulfobacter latus TaxID=2292 RepID=A0A850T5S5_9BACT|nr:response regulator [Desulfobacter latus]NWH03668.1 response regulator [Desulfobacter latus]